MTQKSLLTFLATQGQTDGAVNEREYNFLLGQGVGKKHLNEMWFQYLRNQGYTGSLSDMFLKWLEDDSLTNLSMSGLDTSAPTDAATIGDHASITVGFPVGVTSWTSEAWGVGTYGDTTYGTGSSPSDYTASDGQSLLWEGIGDDGNTYRASAAIKYAPAVNTVAPTVTGDTSLGDTLTTNNGTWTATGGSYSYQWQRDGVDIDGETSTEYTIVVADGSADVRCVVTYTNSGGVVSANSNAVTVDTWVLPTYTVSLGALADGQTFGRPSSGADVEAVLGGSAGAPDDPLTWEYDVDGGGWMSLGPSTAIPTTAGQEITLRISDTDHPAGTFSTTSSPVTVSDAPAEITSLAASNQAADGDVDVTYFITENSLVYGIISTSTTAPAYAQISEGQDHTGSPAAHAFTDTWTISGSATLNDITAGLPSGTYYLHAAPDGSTDAGVKTSTGFTLDTVAPTVTAAETSADGTTVTLTLDKAVSGTNAAGNWGVYDDGSPLGVASVSAISTTTSIVLTLTSAVPDAGSVITFDYTPGDIEDAVSNPLASVIGGSVTNNVTADPWAFTGSIVTNIPATEGWAFTGSVVDTIPEGI